MSRLKNSSGPLQFSRQPVVLQTERQTDAACVFSDLHVRNTREDHWRFHIAVD
jgi:hypothetical protein